MTDVIVRTLAGTFLSGIAVGMALALLYLRPSDSTTTHNKEALR